MISTALFENVLLERNSLTPLNLPIMELYIENNTSVNDVQVQFNSLYPFLQIHFLQSAILDTKKRKPEKLQPERLLHNLINIQDRLTFNVTHETTVGGLVENFRESGLFIMVCRKSGKNWVETSLTQDWALERQNKESMQVDHMGTTHN